MVRCSPQSIYRVSTVCTAAGRRRPNTQRDHEAEHHVQHEVFVLPLTSFPLIDMTSCLLSALFMFWHQHQTSQSVCGSCLFISTRQLQNLFHILNVFRNTFCFPKKPPCWSSSPNHVQPVCGYQWVRVTWRSCGQEPWGRQPSDWSSAQQVNAWEGKWEKKTCQ